VHDVGREPTLAYSLLVTSIEALAQSAQVPDATWADYDSRKRKPINAILESVPDDVGERLKAAILESEHVAIARRFREFIKFRIRPAFYRAEAVGRLNPVTQQDLELLLKDAYAIRSSYVHRLEGLKGLAADPFGHSEVLYSDEKPTLTFAGLARLVRHVIFTFVEEEAKVERETHDWFSDLPNVIRLRVSPTHWLWNPDGYNGATATLWLEAFLNELSGALVSPSSRVSDLSRVLEKIETMDMDRMKNTERHVVLTLYHLATRHAGFQRPANAHLFQKIEREMETLTIEGITACLLEESEFTWDLEKIEALHAEYFRTRWNKSSLRIGRLLESIFTLRLADMHRTRGSGDNARQLISFAVENAPGDSTLLSLEEAHTFSPLSPIDAYLLVKQPK
jgi:hypothetical protein